MRLALGLLLAPLVAADGPSPVQRVVKLLKDMQSQLEDEKSKDEKLYADLQCWCKKNIKDKTGSVAKAKTTENELRANIKKYAGNSGTHEANMERAKANVQKLEKQLESNTAEYEESFAQQKGDELELVNTMGALDNAIKVLSRHSAMLQKKPELLQAMETVVHTASLRNRMLDRKPVQIGQSFLQAQTGAGRALMPAFSAEYSPVLTQDMASRILSQFLQQAGAPGGYASQSGGILGVLKEMKDSFVEDRGNLEKEMADATNAFNKMKATTSQQLGVERKAYKKAKADLSKAKFYSVEGKEELEKTTAAKEADEKVLMEVQMQCQQMDSDWELRSKERAGEIAAIDDALKILMEDENREMTAKTIKFIQMSATERSTRSSVVAALNSAVPTWGELSWNALAVPTREAPKKLALAAQAAKLDSFAKVKKMIDDMVADIKVQKKQDVKSRDQCQDDIRANEKEDKETHRTKELTEGAIEDDQEAIKTMKADRAASIQNVADTRLDIQQASQTREEENKLFQQVVDEQRQTVAILNKVYNRLQQYYKKSFVQQTPMPGSFQPYRQNAGSNGVLGMLEKITADCKQLEATALEDEQKGQAAYEKFVADSNASVDAKNSEIEDLSMQVSERDEQLAENTRTLKAADDQVQDLSKVNTDLHNSCDFLLNHFDLRQQAMETELDGLKKAKAILAGSMAF